MQLLADELFGYLKSSYKTKNTYGNPIGRNLPYIKVKLIYGKRICTYGLAWI